MLGDAPAGLTDDERDLALVFELLGFRRPQDRRVVANQRVRRLEEHAGIFSLLVAAGLGQLGVAVGVVHADAEDLFAARHRRQQFHLGQRKIRPHARNHALDLAYRLGPQHVQHRLQARGEPGLQIDDPVARHHPETRTAAYVITGKMHEDSHCKDRAARFARGTIRHKSSP
jgi:hypothetical protein